MIALFDGMRSLRLLLVVFAFSCGVASAAALAPLPGPNFSVPVAGFEANQGQAKPEILFLSRGHGIAVTAQSILFDPLGARQSFVAGNSDAMVQFIDPLPGVANSFTGPDAQKWVTGIPRFASAYLTGVYPGVDAQYVVEEDGRLTLRLLFQPGVAPDVVVFEIADAVSMDVLSDGYLRAKLGRAAPDPALFFPPPEAFQNSGSEPVSRSVSFVAQSTTRFGFRVDGLDGAVPLQIEMKLVAPGALFFRESPFAVDAAGNTFLAATIPDAAGKDAPFPGSPWNGCGSTIGDAIACADVAVYKFSASGELVFATYLAGRTQEEVRYLALAPDGTVMLAGSTDSDDFPVTATALQPGYAGPPASNRGGIGSPVAGDFFATRLDADDGTPLGSTYLGGPNGETLGKAALGSDGSLYFLPRWLGVPSAGMPVTPAALQRECLGDPCTNGYAAHVSASLDRLLYGTYLPGTTQSTVQLHSDGSVYYAGWAVAGFPTTPTAYQRELAGKEDGIVARLDPSGSSLMFGTYLGGAKTDWISRMAVAPDGSVWVSVSSFEECCIDIEYRLVRLDPNGEQILAERPIDVGDIAVDPEGNLIATAAGDLCGEP